LRLSGSNIATSSWSTFEPAVAWPADPQTERRDGGNYAIPVEKPSVVIYIAKGAGNACCPMELRATRNEDSSVPSLSTISTAKEDTKSVDLRSHSVVQAELQPSPTDRLPLSHCSPPSRTPSSMARGVRMRAT